MGTLSSLVELWQRQLAAAEKSKERNFGKTASRAWEFLSKGYTELYPANSKDEPQSFGEFGPAYACRFAKVQEFVNVYLPYLHQRVPRRFVEPRSKRLPPAVMQLIASDPDRWIRREFKNWIVVWLMEWFLNYLPSENRLSDEVRAMLPEALVKGSGVLWHDLIASPVGDVPISTFETIDGMLVDPDCISRRDAGWIGRRRYRPNWMIAEDFRIPVEHLRSAGSSNYYQAAREAGLVGVNDSRKSQQQDDGDMGEYYEIYSRMGAGARFKSPTSSEQRDKATILDDLGDHVWLAIMPGVPYPLNCPQDALDVGSLSELQGRFEWPIRFYGDSVDPWPCSVLEFHATGDHPWGVSPVRLVLPLQAALDHCYSYLLGRIARTCKDVALTPKTLDKAFENALRSRRDLEVVSTDIDLESLERVFKILQFPPVRGDLYKVVAMIERAFERLAGMTPLLSGASESPGMRSSYEARARQGNLMNRPGDFADRMDDFMARIAAKEGMASRLKVRAGTVAQMFEEPVQTGLGGVPSYGPLTTAWNMFVATEDEKLAAAELSYTVEAGAGRRRNKEKQLADAQMLMQAGWQMFYGHGIQTGDWTQFNGLVDFLSDAHETDLSALKIRAMPDNTAGPARAPGS